MKAAVYYENGGPDVFRYEDVPGPRAAPRRRADRGRRRRHPGRRPAPPRGRRARVGAAHRRLPGGGHGRARSASGSRAFAVGDRVVSTMTTASHAELVSVPAGASRGRCPTRCRSRRPPRIPIEFGTADDCLFEFGRLRPGETVLIQAGAGGVGPGGDPAGQGGRAPPCSPRRRADERLERLGRLRPGPRHRLRHDDVVAEVMRLTDGQRRRPRRRPGRRPHARGEHRRPRLPRPHQLGRAAPAGTSARPRSGR